LKSVVRPAEAAGLVLIRQAVSASQGGLDTEVLLGRRSGRSRFMPGIYVFPGGRVGPEDRQPSGFAEPLPNPPPGLDRATRQRLPVFARAALRETYEETGLLLGAAEAASAHPPRLGAHPPRPGIPGLGGSGLGGSGLGGSGLGSSSLGSSSLGGAAPWKAFAAAGLEPGFSGMRLVARAITPANSPVRFHTRFFLAEGTAAVGEFGGDGELEDIRWAPVESLPDLPMADITHLVLEEALAHRAGAGGLDRPAPLFHWTGPRRYVRFRSQ
jgi:8-oxo-dGTP pyrophosphatase MutT (NUDIX family)